tara:strand:- start:3393 stop:4145 length:753 start_codon:yes stop_codon:yes gene_type:complete
MNQYQQDIAGLQPTQMTASPVLGTETQTTYQTTTQFEGFPIPATNVPVYETVLITADNVRQAIGALEEQEQKAIAYEIFLGVPGAYGGDYELIFNDDGSLNIPNFQRAVEGVIGLAVDAVAYDNTYFLDILQRGDVGEMTPAELAKAFQDRVAEIKAEENKRVVNYIDPVGLQAALNDASASVLGRKMTGPEMKEFVSKIHGMQASGISSIAVGAQAEQFAREAAPVEAGAMDHANAAALIMQAAGIGGR